MLLLQAKKETRSQTGVTKLDVALNGGLEPGEILEIYGKSSVGKSMMAQTILAEICHRRKDGSQALYIDAKNDLIASRLFDIVDRSQSSMRKVRVLRENTPKRILKVLKYFDHEIALGQSQFCEKLRVVVVDSLPAIFYGIKTEDNEQWKRAVEAFMSRLKNMAEKHGLIVILINHAVTDYYSRDKQRQRGGASTSSHPTNPPVKPALGKHWLHFPNFRLLLSQVESVASADPTFRFRATLEKGMRTFPGPYPEFDYRITKKGIVDQF